jgi:hypothetical protein
MSNQFIVRADGGSTKTISLQSEISLDARKPHFLKISQVNIPFVINNITENETIKVTVNKVVHTFTILPGVYDGTSLEERFDAWSQTEGIDGSIEFYFDNNVNRTVFDCTGVVTINLTDNLSKLFGYNKTTYSSVGSGAEFVSESRPKLTDDIMEFFIMTSLNTSSYTDYGSTVNYSTAANVIFHGYFKTPNEMNTYNSQDAAPICLGQNTISNFKLVLADKNFNPIELDQPWSVFFSII